MIEYILDSGNIIIDINGDWDEFALEQGTENMLRNSVLGKPLHQFISGDPTRMYVDTLIGKSRTLNQPHEHQYRCDSPGVRREMIMTVTPLSHLMMYSPWLDAICSDAASVVV